MLYCLSQNSKYFLRYGRMTIAVWELSLGQFPPGDSFSHQLIKVGNGRVCVCPDSKGDPTSRAF